MNASSLTTLGGFAFSVNGNTTRSPATRKARALLAYLIMMRGSDCSRERLLEVFWPDADPDRARDSLSTALYSIRRCVRTAGADADAYFTASKSTVRWTAQTALDAAQFAELAAIDDPDSSRKAVELYRGDFLEGDYDDWTLSERERLASLYENVLARLVHSSKDAETARRFIARNPYDEDAYAVIVEGELAAGRRSSAASWIERCRQALAEINEQPSPDFEQRFAGVAAVEPVASHQLSLPFAGRESELSHLAARLGDAAKRSGSVTLVHGLPGIGKSTLLGRAGQIGTQLGLRVIAVRCNEDAAAFGPWKDLYSAVGAGDFAAFAQAHSSDLATATADAIFSRLTQSAAFVVDDAHTLTGEALDMFIALMRRGASEHAIIAGSRPEGLAVLRARAADVPFEELELGHLDRTHLNWALTDALGSDPPGLLDILYRRTSGHPLFFVGLLNSLVDAGILVRDGRSWRLSQEIGPDIELPGTVRRFIETRLRERGDAARAVACALAIEPMANSEDIGTALGFDESTTLDALDDLLSLGVIVQPASGAQFAFVHDLIREVASVELNAGRRASLHRRFASRLAASGKADASLRLARHLQAAGEPMDAARAYLKSAEEALDLNAVQDAMERCDAGVREAQTLERTRERDALLAALNRTAARGAIAAGSADSAIERARESASLARAADDLHGSARAALDLSIMDGVALDVPAQKSDADLAIQGARACNDLALEAQALIQRAAAARLLGMREDALKHAQSAYDIARACTTSTILPAALEELLRVQITWWLFSDAARTARAAQDAARFEEPFVGGAFLSARSELWYLMDRFAEAQADVQEALRIANESSPRSTDELAVAVHPQPHLQFVSYYMSGKLAIAQERFDAAIEACEKAAALINVVKLPSYGQALSLLRIDALLKRGTPTDSKSASDVLATLPQASRPHGTFGWSDCAELARGRVAARLQMSDAERQLRVLLDLLEENAHQAPLDADIAFLRLADAATEVEAHAIAQRARSRSGFYRAERQAAATGIFSHELRL